MHGSNQGMAKPESFGKYRIERILGRGGMGTVYEAVDPVIHRKVALKTMMQHLSGNPELRARFLREAQAAGGLRHRNIVTVYDLGEDHGQPYIAMEFIEGTDLEKIIQNKDKVSIEWKVDVLKQICEGLAAAHRAGVIHRDVKPANIRVTAEGEVKIMDFGIAHLQASSTMTAGGLVMGTLQYMAPEMVDNRKPDRRADIFSVGAIAYEMLSGRKPFEADSLSAVMYKITHERADPTALPKSRFTPGLERVIMKALHRDLDQRYQTLDDMRSDLATLLAETGAELIAQPDVAQAKKLGDKGRRALTSGDLTTALECAKDALALNPGDPAALALARAAAPPESAPEHVPEKRNVVEDLTAELAHARREGQLQKALSLCRRILEINPNEEVVRLAATEIDKEIKAKEAEQLLAAAVTYAREGDYELSAKIAAKIEKLDPDNPKLKDLRQFIDEETGRKAATALINTAKEHLALGNLEEAIAAAEEALESNPNSAVAREIRDGASRMLAARQPASPPPPPPAPAPAPPAPKLPLVPPPRPAATSVIAAPEPPAPKLPLVPPPPPKPVAPSVAAPTPEPPAPTPAVPRPAPAAPTPLPKPAAPTPPPKPAAPAPVVAKPAATAPKVPAAAASVATPPPVSPAPAAPAASAPVDVAALLDTALNHFLMSDHKKAKKAVEKVLAADPGNKKALELMKILGALP
jgi:serine/threonine-protein kinase